MILGSSGHAASTSGSQIKPTSDYTTVGVLTINGAGRTVATAVQVIATINIDVDDGETELVEIQISSDNGGADPFVTISRVQNDFSVFGLLGVDGTAGNETPVTFEVPSGWTYRIISAGSGSSVNSLLQERPI